MKILNEFEQIDKNGNIVSVSVDGSHGDQRNHKAVRSLLPKKNPIVDLTATSNYGHKPVHYDDEE